MIRTSLSGGAVFGTTVQMSWHWKAKAAQSGVYGDPYIISKRSLGKHQISRNIQEDGAAAIKIAPGRSSPSEIRSGSRSTKAESRSWSWFPVMMALCWRGRMSSQLICACSYSKVLLLVRLPAWRSPVGTTGLAVCVSDMRTTDTEKAGMFKEGL